MNVAIKAGALLIGGYAAYGMESFMYNMGHDMTKLVG